MKLITYSLSWLACLLSLSPAPALAQQYLGEVIPNSMPTTPGSKIIFFNIKDTKGGNTTLLNYFSFPGGKRQDESKVRRAVVIVHGNGQDPATYWGTAWAAISRASVIDKTINESTVSIIAPFFASGDDKVKGYPWTDGLPSGQGSVSLRASYYIILLMNTLSIEHKHSCLVRKLLVWWC
jgi:hypothetical protein